MCRKKNFTTQWFPLLAFYILKVMIFSPFFLLMISYKIHGACFPLISSISSDINFTDTALRKQTLQSLLLERKALRHVPVDGQEETEQPRIVFYRFLKRKRAYLWGNWRPLVNVLWCLMAPSPVDTIQYLGFHVTWQRRLWLGQGTRACCPLSKQICARIHSSLLRHCLYSRLRWLGLCVEQFGLKVTRNLLASCSVSSMIDRPSLTMRKKKGLWIKKANVRSVEMSWLAWIHRIEQDSGWKASGLLTVHQLPSFSSLNKSTLKVHFWSLFERFRS